MEKGKIESAVVKASLQYCYQERTMEKNKRKRYNVSVQFTFNRAQLHGI